MDESFPVTPFIIRFTLSRARAFGKFLPRFQIPPNSVFPRVLMKKLIWHATPLGEAPISHDESRLAMFRMRIA